MSGPGLAFTPAAADMEGRYHGLYVAAMDDGSELIAIGPDLTNRRALAAFSAYTRTVCDSNGTSHRLLAADLAEGLAGVRIMPTRFVRTGDGGWQAQAIAGAEPAAWLT